MRLAPIFALIASLAAPPTFAQDTQITLLIDIDRDTSSRLIKMGEWITVSTSYFGDPASDAAPQDEMGQVYLGGEQVNIYPVSQTLVIGNGLGAAPMDWVVEPRVNVNVFTARSVDENNVIDCGFVDDLVSVVAGTETVISCKWLGE